MDDATSAIIAQMAKALDQEAERALSAAHTAKADAELILELSRFVRPGESLEETANRMPPDLVSRLQEWAGRNEVMGSPKDVEV